MIGGIPSRFLDLSHFPHLKKKKSFQNGLGQHHHQTISSDILSPDKEERTKSDMVQEINSKKRQIIDCTEDFAIPQRHHHRIPSFGGDIRLPSSSTMRDRNEGIPRELNVPHHHHRHQDRMHNSSSSSKRNVRRAYVAHASLSHVNGPT